MKEPIRLVDDPALSAALRRDLDLARRAEAPFDQDAGLARLLSAIAAGTATAAAGAAAEAAQTAQAAQAAGGAAADAAGLAAGSAQTASQAAAAGLAGTAGTATSGALAKTVAFLVGKGAYWGLAAAGVASVALAVTFATDDSRRPGAPPPALTAPAEPAAVAGPAGALPDRGTDGKDPAPSSTAAPDLGAAPGAPAAPSTTPKASAAAPTASADRSRLAAEVRHLSELRTRLADRPEDVVAGAADGTRTFADGALAEEREALAIEALVKLGRKTEARSRAATFLARYPKSPLAARVRALGVD